MAPNLPLLLIRGVLHIKFGLFNLDYFLLSLIACSFSPMLASVLFVVVYALELVRLLDSLFYFSQSDPLFAIRFVGELHKALVLSWAAAFVLICGLSLWLWRTVLPRTRGRHLWRAALPVGVALLLLVAVDQARGFRLFGSLRHLRSGNRAVDELLLRIPLSVGRSAPGPTAVASYGNASAPLWNRDNAMQQHDDVLLVLVESMGRIRNKDGNAREFALFHDPGIEGRYNVSEGTVPFTGSTVSGEMRELCRLRTGMYISPDTLKGHTPCLPGQYRDAGYEAIAFHGYRATMFQRDDWYPQLGFSEERFLGNMGQLPTCDGAFYGVCDDAVAGLVKDRLEARAAGAAPPQFLYWLTLNSHLAVDEEHAPREACPIVANRHVCAHLAYVQRVLELVKEIALDRKIARTAIVVVGDHAPPFMTPEDRSRFDGSAVPFLYLSPR